METFLWRESYGCRAERKPRVLVARFGDGYEQRVAQGLRPVIEVWRIGFDMTDEGDARVIDAFLQRHAGITAFLWNPPDRTDSIRVVCREWTLEHPSFGFSNISAQFEEVAL